MCVINKKHLQSFKGGTIVEDAGRDIFTIVGMDPDDGCVVTLNFPAKTPSFCDGTTSSSTLVCRLDHSEWAVAKVHAREAKDYFHVHGTVVDTKHVVSASLCYFANP